MRLNIYVKDEKIYSYIKSQPNYSAYITNLVKDDMNRSKPVNEEKVIELIKKYGGEIKDTPDAEVKELIEGLLDW